LSNLQQHNFDQKAKLFTIFTLNSVQIPVASAASSSNLSLTRSSQAISTLGALGTAALGAPPRDVPQGVPRDPGGSGAQLLL
jgi:hypothetical protein